MVNLSLSIQSRINFLILQMVSIFNLNMESYKRYKYFDRLLQVQRMQLPEQYRCG